MANDCKAMGHVGGKSVQSRDYQHLHTGEYDADLHDLGPAWPRQHHNKLRISQELEGDREGEMHGGHTAKIEGAPTPAEIATMMEDNSPMLQRVFDQYARQANYICLTEFAEYAAAHGMSVADERILEDLLANNRDFMFQEHRDAQGRYWTAVAEAKCMGPAGNDGARDDDESGKAEFCTKCYSTHKPGECKRCDEGVSRALRADGQPIRETRRDFEEVPPESLATAGLDDFEEEQGEFEGEPRGGPGDEKPFFANDDRSAGGGPYESGCPECPGALDETGYCPDCGYQDEQYGRSMADTFAQDTFPDPAAAAARRDAWGYPPTRGRRAGSHQVDDDFEEGALVDGDAIVEADLPQYKAHQGAPADHTAPLPSNDVDGGERGKMGHLGGKSVNPRRLDTNSGLPQEKTDTSDMGEVWPRRHTDTPAMCAVDVDGVTHAPQGGHESTHATASDGHQRELRDLNLRTKQKNTGQQWEKFDGWLQGSGCVLSGGAKKMQENVEKLGRHVLGFLKRCVQESGLLRPGARYKGTFVVSAGEFVQPHRHTSLTEAVVDAEELLQIFGPEVVTMEARYLDGNNRTVMRKVVPLPRLPLRGPLMAEHKALFRFPELARDYADMLVESGRACAATTHNWGAAVSAGVPYQIAQRAFHAIREGTPPVV